MKKEWKLNKKAQETKAKTIIEKLLAGRGIVKEEDVREFLNPLELTLTHPNAFCGMKKAVERLSKAIDNKENILVYGDFDADGVTSTSLLMKTFKELDANVDYFVPDREKEGHGLNTKALVKLLTTKKPKVIVTVDCASSDVEQVTFLNSFKVDVIITDHHEAPEVLPQAYSIINPKAQDALDESLTAKEIQSLTSLAGVGVAFKLAHAMLEHYKKLEYLYYILPFVAVGTIADLVPLVGENRYYVTKGLQIISEGKHFGLKRLLEEAGYDLAQGITSEQIAFGVAPRINASGRLDTVESAMKVMISENKQEIEMAIVELNGLNKLRQDLCENNFLEADEMLQKEGNKNNAIVLFNPNWQVGIVGIVASKLVEKYYKPTFLMTYSEETKQIRCSARGIEEVNIYDVLSANSELFDGFGGHAMAGGLSFSAEKVSFEEVKKAINKTVDEILGNRKLNPMLEIDLELLPNDVDGNLVSDIQRLQPFGAANPNPVFAMYNLTLLQKKLMGSNKNHLKLVVEDSNHDTYDCIWWSKGDVSLNSGDVLDIAFCPQTNTFNGNTTLQFILQDIHADNLVEEIENKNEIKIYDHRQKTGILPTVEDYVKTSNLKIGVFAEDRKIIESLKPYKELSKRIFNRNNLSDYNAVMFFDYPPSKEIFDEIMQQISPKFIHFMKYEASFDEKEFLKTFSGMLKFASNNKSGCVELERCAAFLGQTKEAVIEALDVFEQAEIIIINDKNTQEFVIDFVQNAEISKALHSPSYKSFIEEISATKEYKNSFSQMQIDEITN